MNISIETQQLIDELVASGRFANCEEVIAEAVKVLEVGLKNELECPPSQPSAENWCEQFDEWALGHRPLAQEADDRRETIYQGRDE